MKRNYFVNEDIRNTGRIFPMQGRYDFKRYDMNENPEGLPREFVEQVLTEITPEFLATYPEPGRFIRKYAKTVGVSEDHVSVANGSDMAIRYILETFGEKGKEVVTVSPSFEMYRIHCSILGLNHVPISYEIDLSLDFEKLLSAIGEQTRVVSVVNPNMPIGTVYTEEQVEALIMRAREVGAIVVIDEAYHYFYSQSMLKFMKQFDNVLVLRTFSKFFSLAACRLGVVIGHPTLITYFNQGRLSFDVNAVALLFGERLLEREDIICSMIESERAGKQYALEMLTERGYVIPESYGNFLLIPTHRSPSEVAERLKMKKILVHIYSNPLLKDYVRISTGSVPVMKEVLFAFFEADR